MKSVASEFPVEFENVNIQSRNPPTIVVIQTADPDFPQPIVRFSYATKKKKEKKSATCQKNSETTGARVKFVSLKMSNDKCFNTFESLAVGSEWKPVEEVRPMSVPIYASSTFKVTSVAHGEALSGGKVQSKE